MAKMAGPDLDESDSDHKHESAYKHEPFYKHQSEISSSPIV